MMDVERRHLGTRGLSFTPIGLGLAGGRLPAYLGRRRDEELGADRSRRSHGAPDSRAARRAAYDSGVRYVDAARSYGLRTLPRTWLAERKRPPGDPVVGSKWATRYVGRLVDGRQGA